MIRIFFALALMLAVALPAQANPRLEAVIAGNLDQIERPSRKTVGPLLEQIATTGPEGGAMLAAWADRRLGMTEDGRVVIVEGEKAFDAVTGAEVTAADIDMLQPNSGVRGLIAAALVVGQISDPDRKLRAQALNTIARSGTAEHLTALRDAPADPDPALQARRTRLQTLLTIQFDSDPAARVAALQEMSGDVALDFRAALNPLLTTRRIAETDQPEDANIAQELTPGSEDLSFDDAYDLLKSQDLARPRLTAAAQRDILIAHIEDGKVGGVPVETLNDPEAVITPSVSAVFS